MNKVTAEQLTSLLAILTADVDRLRSAHAAADHNEPHDARLRAADRLLIQLGDAEKLVMECEFALNWIDADELSSTGEEALARGAELVRERGL